MFADGKRLTLFDTDPALGVVPRKRYLIWGLLGFAIYLGCVIGGSILQEVLGLPLEMGWGQQILSALAVLLVAAFLKERTAILAWQRPVTPWIRWSVLAGVAIALTGLVIGFAIGEQPRRHGVEYFVYEATLPGLAEELGFRGLLFGCLLAAFGARPKSRLTVWVCAIAQALPFAALHGLEASGFRLLGLFVYTAFAGIVLALVRLKTGSLFPAIVGHNIANVTGGVINMILLL